MAGKGFDDALQRARGQAEAYARALPADGKAGKESAAPGGAPAPAGRIPWPDKLPRQVAAVARILGESPVPLSEARIPARFAGRGLCKKRLRQLVETLVALRRARVADGRYVGA